MSHTRERRVKLGAILLDLCAEQRKYDSLEEFFSLARQEAEQELAAILKNSRSNPTRLEFHYQEDEQGYDYCEPAALIVYGYRPETDRERAARLKRRKKAAEKKQQHAADKEDRERQLLRELQAKYPND